MLRKYKNNILSNNWLAVGNLFLITEISFTINNNLEITRALFIVKLSLLYFILIYDRPFYFSSCSCVIGNYVGRYERNSFLSKVTVTNWYAAILTEKELGGFGNAVTRPIPLRNFSIPPLRSLASLYCVRRRVSPSNEVSSVKRTVL